MVEQIAQVDSRFVLGRHQLAGSQRAHALHGRWARCSSPRTPRSLPPGRFERLTPKTITVRARLEEELADVRLRGYAVTNEELEVGLSALAAPVRRRDGAVIAAISVSGPSTRFNASSS